MTCLLLQIHKSKNTVHSPNYLQTEARSIFNEENSWSWHVGPSILWGHALCSCSVGSSVIPLSSVLAPQCLLSWLWLVTMNPDGALDISSHTFNILCLALIAPLMHYSGSDESLYLSPYHPFPPKTQQYVMENCQVLIRAPQNFLAFPREDAEPCIM